MKQVADEFTKKWREYGTVTKAARPLGINPKSFYKYAHGTDLPRVEVLLAAHQKWEIEWDLIDASTLFRKLKPSTQEQLVLPLLRSIREEDVEVIEVVTGNDSSLSVKLQIRFSTNNSVKTRMPGERIPKT
jgi:hypothetical protein